MRKDQFIKRWIASAFSWSSWWAKQTGNIAASWVESNREGEGCMYYLITQNIDNDYKNFLMYNLLINI